MRILVISDTHGRLDYFKEVLKIEHSIDYILHTGDVGRDENEIRMLAGERCGVAFVRGNCDFLSQEPDSRDFELGGVRIHMEHGHLLSGSLQSIYYKAKELGADIMISGHTHQPLIVHEQDVWIINPGSLEKPRQYDEKHTYIIIETEKDSPVKITKKSVD